MKRIAGHGSSQNDPSNLSSRPIIHVADHHSRTAGSRGITTSQPTPPATSWTNCGANVAGSDEPMSFTPRPHPVSPRDAVRNSHGALSPPNMFDPSNTGYPATEVGQSSEVPTPDITFPVGNSAGRELQHRSSPMRPPLASPISSGSPADVDVEHRASFVGVAESLGSSSTDSPLRRTDTNYLPCAEAPQPPTELRAGHHELAEDVEIRGTESDSASPDPPDPSRSNVPMSTQPQPGGRKARASDAEAHPRSTPPPGNGDGTGSQDKRSTRGNSTASPTGTEFPVSKRRRIGLLCDARPVFVG